jgi:hypothetical protein
MTSRDVLPLGTPPGFPVQITNNADW